MAVTFELPAPIPREPLLGNALFPPETAQPPADFDFGSTDADGLVRQYVEIGH